MQTLLTLVYHQILQLPQDLSRLFLQVLQVLLSILRDPIWQSLAIILGICHTIYHHFKGKQESESRKQSKNVIQKKILHCSKHLSSLKALLLRKNRRVSLNQETNRATQVARFGQKSRFRHIKKMPKTARIFAIMLQI
jgi:hypothetical protein